MNGFDWAVLSLLSFHGCHLYPVNWAGECVVLCVCVCVCVFVCVWVGAVYHYANHQAKIFNAFLERKIIQFL